MACLASMVTTCSIEAGLAKVGGLTITTNGGAGGRRRCRWPWWPGDFSPTTRASGGNGGSGGRGGNAGQISIIWTRLAPHLPSVSGALPSRSCLRQQRRSVAGAGGAGGSAGVVGIGGGSRVRMALPGANGTSLPAQVTWRANPAGTTLGPETGHGTRRRALITTSLSIPGVAGLCCSAASSTGRPLATHGSGMADSGFRSPTLVPHLAPIMAMAHDAAGAKDIALRRIGQRTGQSGTRRSASILVTPGPGTDKTGSNSLTPAPRPGRATP